MATTTIPEHSNERRASRAPQPAPPPDWYTERGAALDPTNFGREDVDPQHYALFNGTTGGRSHSAASFPQRTLDTGLHFNPTPSPLTSSGAAGAATPSPHHPEILTEIARELWTPSTSHGALGQALAVATDSPPSIAGPSEPPLTISPPLDPEDLPEIPEGAAPEGSLRAKRQAEAAAGASGASRPAAKPAAKPAERK